MMCQLNVSVRHVYESLKRLNSPLCRARWLRLCDCARVVMWKKSIKIIKKSLIACQTRVSLTHPKIELMFTIWPRSLRSLSLSRISFTASRVTVGRGEEEKKREKNRLLICHRHLDRDFSLVILISSSSQRQRDRGQRTYAERQNVCIHDFRQFRCVVVIKNESFWVNVCVVDLEQEEKSDHENFNSVSNPMWWMISANIDRFFANTLVPHQ